MNDADRIEALEETIRCMLDFTVGWCRNMTDAEKLEAIKEIGREALGLTWNVEVEIVGDSGQ